MSLLWRPKAGQQWALGEEKMLCGWAFAEAEEEGWAGARVLCSLCTAVCVLWESLGFHVPLTRRLDTAKQLVERRNHCPTLAVGEGEEKKARLGGNSWFVFGRRVRPS